MVRRSLLALLLLPALPAQDDVTAWIGELHRARDDADVGVVARIAGVRTREAAKGLIEGYDLVATLLFRREILRGLLQYTGTPEAEQPVLEKLAAVAGDPDTEEELRALAITGLGQSPTIGRQLLKRIVDSELPDALREPALRAHVAQATAEDAAWYRHLWNVKQEQRKDAKGEIAAPELNTVRQLAVQGVLQFCSEDELIEALKREVDPKIRRAVLAFMHRHSMPKTAEMAEWMLDRVDASGAERAEAARTLIERVGVKAVDTFLDLARKSPFVTQADLREQMAGLLANLGDESVDKRTVKLLGKGKPHEKVFALLATAKVTDPKVVATVRKGLADPALEVRRAAAQVLGERRDRESLPQLRKLMASKDGDDVRLAIEAITAIEGASSAWTKELAGYAAHADREVRNAAIGVIGDARDKRHIAVVLQALTHDDWSTRFAAIAALQSMRHKQAVGPLIERMAVETGRMRKRIAEALWHLTAQPFDEDLARWQGWWRDAEAKFTVATDKDLDRAEAERERKRLAARTTVQAKFFGLQVESQRVIFVLDVSGSMLESMYGRYVGKRGAARIDVAKEELKQAIENLEPGTLFNVFTFASSVARWQKEGIGIGTEQSRQAALEWIDRLGAQGATNLYDSVKQAFEDPDVDTIFILSDGEPTNGEVIDPHRIREDVAFWNRHRRIKINTIAIGGNLEILEWLAKDSGGTYLQMR